MCLQGEMVNNIEVNVSNAAEYISKAKEETKKAVRYQKKSRRVSTSPGSPASFGERNEKIISHWCPFYACMPQNGELKSPSFGRNTSSLHLLC